MCNAGIPVLDVYQMSESAPTDDKQAVVTQAAKLLTQYFLEHPRKLCIKNSNTSKATINQVDVNSPVVNFLANPVDKNSPVTNFNSSGVKKKTLILQTVLQSPTIEAKSPANNTVGSLFKMFGSEETPNKKLVT